MKYLTFSVPGSSGPIPIEPVAGMPSGGTNSVETLIRWGVTTLLAIAVLLALFFLIFGGIQWIMSQGDKSKVQAASKRITFAIIGLIVAFSAFFIINTLGHLFGVKLITSNCRMITQGKVVCN